MADGRKNLVDLRDRTPEERREIARMGGLASHAAYLRRKTLKEELTVLLSDPQLQKQLCEALIVKALKGSASAFTAIRDTIGEKPAAEVGIYPAVSVTDLDNLTVEERRTLGSLMMAAGGDPSLEALSVEAKEKLLDELL